MILINSICIVLLVIYLLFILSNKLIDITISQRIEDTARNILVLIMFVLSIGAIVSKLCIWIF